MKLAVALLAIPLLFVGIAAGPATPTAKAAKEAGDNIAKTVEKKNSDSDLVRVHMSYAKEVDGKLVAYVFVHWGDLDRKITYSRDHYANWDGNIAVEGGKLKLYKKIRFDDRSGKEPRKGSGVDKLGRRSTGQVAWQSGVVGGTDGLVFKVAFENSASSVKVNAGGHTIELTPITQDQGSN